MTLELAPFQRFVVQFGAAALVACHVLLFQLAVGGLVAFGFGAVDAALAPEFAIELKDGDVLGAGLEAREGEDDS